MEKKLIQFEDSVLGKEDHDAQEHRQTTREVVSQGEEGVINGLLISSVGDQDEGADGRDLPEEVEPKEIVAEDDAEHGREENKDDEEEGAAFVGDVFLVRVVGPHISQGIHGDQAADDSRDQGHDEGKPVQRQRNPFPHGVDVHDFKPQADAGGGQDKRNNRPFPVADGEHDHVRRQRQFDDLHQQPDPVRMDLIQVDGRRIIVLQQPAGRDDQQDGGGDDDEPARGIPADQDQRQGCDDGIEDQEYERFHFSVPYAFSARRIDPACR
ncbi:MAG: hypothetical protein A4E73_01063 [Syntrophaceae bacterium PtaU1.Bin231]|nr:MAG: hypothetical protein A4E73_01063 [Syntrophaceae bacterium PtaU1.Bin231]